MSAPELSTRTVLRNTAIQLLEARKGQSVVRVPSFAVSPRFLLEQETNQANTYCVLVTDEQVEAFTQTRRLSRLTLRIVVYAHDTKDPRAVLDAMIEDAHELVATLAEQAALQGRVWQFTPIEIITDDSTTAAGPWARALCQWTAQHSRA